MDSATCIFCGNVLFGTELCSCFVDSEEDEFILTAMGSSTEERSLPEGWEEVPF